MQLFFLKFIWPILQKPLANRAADYLKNRREQRLRGVQDIEDIEELECPPCPPCPSDEPSSTPTEQPSGNPVLFALAGVVLGSLFSALLYYWFGRQWLTGDLQSSSS